MWREWLRWLWENEDGFFGVGQGPSGREKEQYGILTGVEKFGISTGEKAVSEAERFWSAIMSGDPLAISRVLGPTISTISKQGQQEKKTLSEFGTRSGGTTAAASLIDDNTLSSIRGLLGNLTGTAATAKGEIGRSMLGLGVGAGGIASDLAVTMQQQDAAKWKDIFSSISKVAAGFAGMEKVPETGVIGALGG